jgi:hypothetical protein
VIIAIERGYGGLVGVGGSVVKHIIAPIKKGRFIMLYNKVREEELLE